MSPLPLWPGAVMCLRSGYCCKKALCPFGKWNLEKTQCEHLVGEGPGKYSCSIAEEIEKVPGSEISPAFGAGCCSSMNSDRGALLKK